MIWNWTFAILVFSHYASLSLTHCQATACPSNELMPNVFMSTAAKAPYKPGDRIRFRCHPGYILMGGNMITCLSNGRWSRGYPRCQGKAAAWTSWDEGPCSKTCGEGIKRSSRKCLKNGALVHVYQCGAEMNSDKKEEKCQVGDCDPVNAICGKPIVVPNRGPGRVIAGEKAKPGAWPWQALVLGNSMSHRNKIYRRNLHVSGGGSVINDRWILTAAHVMHKLYDGSEVNTEKAVFVIALGVTVFPEDILKWTQHTRIYTPKTVKNHDRFNITTYDYDLALIRIGKRLISSGEMLVADGSSTGEISFNDYVRPICLPCMEYITKSGEFDQHACREWGKSIINSSTRSVREGVVTGFGRKLDLYGHFIDAEHLQQGDLRILKDTRCKQNVEMMHKSLEGFTEIDYTGRMVCAEAADRFSRTDACQGDSGGPLAMKIYDESFSSRYLVFGIVSWGVGCGSRFPGYYASVTPVMTWILKEIGWLDPETSGRDKPKTSDSKWGQWSAFRECTVSCGGGTTFRSRKCQNGDCEGKTWETKYCNTEECATYVFDKWEHWDTCSTTCGLGSQRRQRKCVEKTSRKRVKISQCSGQGNNLETRSCDIAECKKNCTSSSCNGGLCFKSGVCGCFHGFCGSECNKGECENHCHTGLYFEDLRKCLCWEDYGYDDEGRCTVDQKSMCVPSCDGSSVCRHEIGDMTKYFCDSTFPKENLEF